MHLRDEMSPWKKKDGKRWFVIIQNYVDFLLVIVTAKSCSRTDGKIAGSAISKMKQQR